MVSGFLVALPGGLRGNIVLLYESLTKERVGVWALDWWICISKARSQGSCLLFLGIG